MTSSPEENELISTRRFEVTSANRRFELTADRRRFTPALFFLVAAVAWTGLTIYLSTIYFWNLIIGSIVTASLYGLAWRFRSEGRRAKIR